MSRGRKRKPDAIKKLEGTYRKDRANDDQPEFGPLDITQQPENLDPKAKWLLERTIPLLDSVGVLQETDREMVMMLVNEYHTYWKLDKAAKLILDLPAEELDSDKVYELSKLRIMQKNAFEGARRLMMELGMTPASRQKLKVEKPPEIEDVFDIS